MNVKQTVKEILASKGYDFETRKPETFEEIVDFGYQIAKFFLKCMMKGNADRIAEFMAQRDSIRELIPVNDDYPIPESLQSRMSSRFPKLLQFRIPQNLLFDLMQDDNFEEVKNVCDYCLHVDAFNSFVWYMYAFLVAEAGDPGRAAMFFLMSSIFDPFGLNGTAERNCLLCLYDAGSYQEMITLHSYWQGQHNLMQYPDWDGLREIVRDACGYVCKVKV